MRFIGDVHGKFPAYLRLIAGVGDSIQVGDLRAGYHVRTPDGAWQAVVPPFQAMRQAGNHRFIRGNQDNPEACRKQPLWIADGHSEGDMFFCGGARSMNRARRTEGMDWWPDEELSQAAFQRIQAAFIAEKPTLVVTHDCPATVAREMARHHDLQMPVSLTRTRSALEEMWRRHQPDTWIFGHWHLPFDGRIAGTRFICLDELETLDL